MKAIPATGPSFVNDDVVLRLQRLAGEGEGEPREVETRELTSRANASEIPRLLRQLDVPYGQPDALDVMLATNMISVGVDVKRLGLMVVAGQPKTTAEYIQATSRVGRDPERRSCRRSHIPRHAWQHARTSAVDCHPGRSGAGTVSSGRGCRLHRAAHTDCLIYRQRPIRWN